MEVYQRVMEGDVKYPKKFSTSLIDLCGSLLQQRQSKRLGNMKRGIQDVVKHKWFSGFDWSGLKALELRPPIPVEVKNELDTSNFDPIDDEDDSGIEACDWWLNTK